VLSGAVGGAVWGSVAGALATIGILQASGSGMEIMDVITLPQVNVTNGRRPFKPQAVFAGANGGHRTRNETKW
jgi:hypothetical protein